MVSANNLKQYARPDVSQMTLDVIEAYKTNQTVQFKYGGQDAIRELFIIDWHEDYYTFHGWLAPEGEGGEYRKFRFDKVDEWLGIPIQYKVYVELDMSGYPIDDDVSDKLHELLDSDEPVVYRIEPQGL